MKTTAADSTMLRTIGYDAERQLLQIEFRNHSIYQYFDVPEAVYEELIHASSKGAYFNQCIRLEFDFAQVKGASLS
jgi:KTSC domain